MNRRDSGPTRRQAVAGLMAGAAMVAGSAKGAMQKEGVGPTDQLADEDALGIADLIRRRQVSATEVMDIVAARIERLEPHLNALTDVDINRGRDIASRGEGHGVFAGVPFLIKDTLAYPGLRHSLGSKLFARQVPENGTPYSALFDKAGLITIGKTAVPEFALVGATESSLEGITRNPWDLSRSPAGSSGGAAAAVASGMLPLAHASDGGGSIRIPASVCGLFGFKPGRGRIVDQIVERGGHRFEIVSNHAVSRTVRDSAALFAASERSDGPFPIVGFVRDPVAAKLRIGFHTINLLGCEPDPEVKEAAEQTALLCESLGHEVIATAPPPLRAAEIRDAYFTYAGANLSAIADQLTAAGRVVDTEVFEPFTLSLIEWYRGRPADALDRTFDYLARASRTMNDYLSQFDVVLTPTIGLLPRPIGWLDTRKLSFDEIMSRTQQLACYTPVHNQAGAAAMSVPLCRSLEGLPIGMHFAAKAGQEATLFGLAYQLESARPWAEIWPSISIKRPSLPSRSTPARFR